MKVALGLEFVFIIIFVVLLVVCLVGCLRPHLKQADRNNEIRRRFVYKSTLRTTGFGLRQNNIYLDDR